MFVLHEPLGFEVWLSGLNHHRPSFEEHIFSLPLLSNLCLLSTMSWVRGSAIGFSHAVLPHHTQPRHNSTKDMERSLQNWEPKLSLLPLKVTRISPSKQLTSHNKVGLYRLISLIQHLSLSLMYKLLTCLERICTAPLVLLPCLERIYPAPLASCSLSV